MGDAVESYRAALADLTFNSKPLINMLTMLAEENEQLATDIAQVVEDQIYKAPANQKLPILYLIDSMIKNLSTTMYPQLFIQNIVVLFCRVFEEVDEKTRTSMYKLRQTWKNVLPNNKLFALDVRVKRIDPAWPVTAATPDQGSIHVNPKFLAKQKQQQQQQLSSGENSPVWSSSPQSETSAPVQETPTDKKMKELLEKEEELKRLKLELELARTRAKLDEEKRRLEQKQQEEMAQIRALQDRVGRDSPGSTPPDLASLPPPRPAQSTATTQPSQASSAASSRPRDPRLSRDPRLANTMANRDPRRRNQPLAATHGHGQTQSDAGQATPPALQPDQYQQYSQQQTYVAASPQRPPIFQPQPSHMLSHAVHPAMGHAPSQPFVPAVSDPNVNLATLANWFTTAGNSAPPAPSVLPAEPKPRRRSPDPKVKPVSPAKHKEKELTIDSIPLPKSSKSSPTQKPAKKAKPKVKPPPEPQPEKEAAPTKFKINTSEVTDEPPPQKIQEAAKRNFVPKPKKSVSDSSLSSKPKKKRSNENLSDSKKDGLSKKEDEKEREKQLMESKEKTDHGKEKDKSDAERESDRAKSSPEKKLESKDKGYASSKEKKNSSRPRRSPSLERHDRERRDSKDSDRSRSSVDNERLRSSKDRRTSLERDLYRRKDDRRRSPPRHNMFLGHRGLRGRARFYRRHHSPSRSRSVSCSRSRSRSPVHGEKRKDTKQKTSSSTPSASSSEITSSKSSEEVAPTSVPEKPVNIDDRAAGKRPSDTDHSDDSGPLLKKARPSPSEDSATETSIQESDSKEDMGNIFSGEDVDYRQQGPSVHQSPAQQRWSKFKENHPDDFSFEMERRKSADEVRRASLAAAGVSGPRHQDFERELQDVDFRKKSSGPPRAPLLPAPGSREDVQESIPEVLSLDNQREVLMQAEREVQAGRMSHEEHQKLLRQLGHVYSMQRQRRSSESDYDERSGNADIRLRSESRPADNDFRQGGPDGRKASIDSGEDRDFRMSHAEEGDVDLRRPSRRDDASTLGSPLADFGSPRDDYDGRRGGLRDFDAREPRPRPEFNRGRDSDASNSPRANFDRPDPRVKRPLLGVAPGVPLEGQLHPDRDDRRPPVDFDDRDQRRRDPRRPDYDVPDFDGRGLPRDFERRPRGPPGEMPSGRDFTRRGLPDEFDRRGGPPGEFDRRGPPRDFDARSPLEDFDRRRGPPREFDRRRAPRGPREEFDETEEYDPREGSSEDYDGPPEDLDQRSLTGPLRRRGPPREFDHRAGLPEDFDRRRGPPRDVEGRVPLRNGPVDGFPPPGHESLPESEKRRLYNGPRPLFRPPGPGGLRPRMPLHGPLGPRGPRPMGMPSPRPDIMHAMRPVEIVPGSSLDDPRWSVMAHFIANQNECPEEVVIDGKPYEVRMGVKRRVKIRGQLHEVFPDTEERGLRIDGNLLYKFGEPKKDVEIGERVVEMFYHGPPRKFWVDGQQYKLRLDAPPFNMTFDGTVYGFQIDGRDNMLLVDRLEKGPFGGPTRPLILNGVQHEICFEMQRRILIDNQSCELKLDREIPVIMYNGKPHGIRFEGEPRNLFINDVAVLVPMDKAVKASLPTETGTRTHFLAFGGPAHEVIIDGKWFEVKFNNIPKNITIGNRVYSVRLEPPVPRVKILSEITHGFEETPKPAYPHLPQPPLPPTLPPRGPQPSTANTEAKPAAASQEDEAKPSMSQPENSVTHAPNTVLPNAAVTAGPSISLPNQMPHSTGVSMSGQPGVNVPNMMQAGVSMPGHPGVNMPQSAMRMSGPMGPGPMSMMRGPGPMNNPMNNPMTNALSNPWLVMQGLNMIQSLPTGGPNQLFSGLPGALMNIQRMMSSQMPQGMNAPSFPQMAGQPGPSVQQFMGAPGIQRMGGPHGSGSMPPMGPMSQSNPQATLIPPSMPTQTITPAPSLSTTPNPGPAAQPPAKPVDVSDLLTKLLAAGIIKSEKKEETKAEVKEPKEVEAEEEVTAPKSDSPGPSQQAPKPKVTPKKEPLVRPPDLSDFQSQKLRKQYSGVVHDLYEGIQCSSCGCRFPMEDTEHYRQHLDWHFRLNKREKEAAKVASFRKWYYELNDWILYQSIDESEDNLTSAFFEEDLARQNQDDQSGAFAFHAPAGVQVVHSPVATGNETEDVCVICHDPFEQYWDQEAEEWHLRNAIGVEGKTYHPVCYEDAREGGNWSDVTPTPVAEMLENPLVKEIKQQTDPGVSGAYTELPPSGDAADATKLSEGGISVSPALSVKAEPISEPVTVKMEPQESALVVKTAPAIAAPIVKTEPMDTVDKESVAVEMPSAAVKRESSETILSTSGTPLSTLSGMSLSTETMPEVTSSHSDSSVEMLQVNIKQEPSSVPAEDYQTSDVQVADAQPTDNVQSETNIALTDSAASVTNTVPIYNAVSVDSIDWTCDIQLADIESKDKKKTVSAFASVPVIGTPIPSVASTMPARLEPSFSMVGALARCQSLTVVAEDEPPPPGTTPPPHIEDET